MENYPVDHSIYPSFPSLNNSFQKRCLVCVHIVDLDIFQTSFSVENVEIAGILFHSELPADEKK